MSETTKPNPGVAAVLSFIFSGLGQLYNGEIVKGLVMIGVSTLNLLVIILGAIFIGYWLKTVGADAQSLFTGGVLFLIGIMIMVFLGIYSIFDAYRFVKKS